MKNFLLKVPYSLTLILLLLFSITKAQTPVSRHGALSVSGNSIVDRQGASLSLAGNSFFWSNTGWGSESFYNAQVVSWLKNDWNSAIVRAAMGVDDEGGYLSDPNGNKNRVTTLVDAAISEGLYVIIDWHSHNAQNYQSQAISFFRDMASRYGNYDNVIYEIYNEPTNVSWSGGIKPYALAVIAAIRAIDPDNLIVVGTPTWSQDVDAASQDPITGYNNIAYSLHFYAGTHGQYLRNKATTAMNNGIAIMITEYGTVNADGDGAVASQAFDEWMNFMKQHKLTHLNWAVNDKAEGSSIVYPGASPYGGWSSNNLTPSGALVRQIMRDWNDSGPGGGDNLSLSTSSLNYSAGGGSNTINVTSNVNWNVSADQSWLSVSPNSGNNNGPFTLTAASNSGTSSRNGSVTVTGGGISQTIAVTQDGKSGGGGGGSACDNPTPVSLPFSYDGVGNFCFEVSGSINYVNSWNADLVEVNGADYTNQWSNSFPAAINGKYYIKYTGNVPWSHIEVTGSSNSRSGQGSQIESQLEMVLHPNPATDEVILDHLEKYDLISIRNLAGQLIHEQPVANKNQLHVRLSGFAPGTYFVTATGKSVEGKVLKLLIE